MRLGNDEVNLPDAPGGIVLRPSLRAAFQLEQKYGSYQELMQAILTANMSVLADILKAGTGRTSALTDYLDQLGNRPIAISMDLLMEPMVKFICALIDVDDLPNIQAGKPVSFGDYYRRLFRIATGYLGWSPEQAWNATPAEILEAYEGRKELLAAIFGGGKDEPAKTDNVIDATKGKVDSATRAQLNALGNMAVNSMSQVP